MRHPLASSLGSVALSLLAAACSGEHAAAAPSAATEESAFAEVLPGSTRIELAMTPFDLQPGDEVYKCQNFANPFGRDVAVLQSQSVMSPGSHHMFAFRVPEDTARPIEDCSGLEFHAAIHATQLRVDRTTYPAGVGAFHPATQGIRLNAHYFNLGTEPIHANVRVAFDVVGPEEVREIAAQILLGDTTLDIPPGQGTAGGTLSLPPEVGAVRLLRAESHMHRRGVGFTAALGDGTSIYQSSTWDEPPVAEYTPPVQLVPEEKVTFRCSYVNETAQHITFGESADSNEMCVFTGFYYPSPGGKTILGDLSFGTKLTE